MTLTVCVVCGEPCNGSRCPDHQLPSAPKRPTGARGYGWTWQQLSKRARRLQPFCTLCGATEDLQTDHTPEAWQRFTQGKAIRLQDVRVLCGPCNRAAGRARPTGVTPPESAPVPPGQADFRSHTALLAGDAL